MIDVKICGITSMEDALLALSLGASAIGMVFYDKSPRYIDFKKRNKWILELTGQIKKVGVFVNAKIDEVNYIAKCLELDYIQLHGNESPEYCERINSPIIKAVSVDKAVDNFILNQYKVDAFLFDSYVKGMKGGSGKVFNWECLLNINVTIPIILSGGLNRDNVLKGINMIMPVAIDICSGVELYPGKKDEIKMKDIFYLLKDTRQFIKYF